MQFFAPRIGLAHAYHLHCNTLVSTIDDRPQIGASIGIAIYPAQGDNLQVPIQKADKAMYTTKVKFSVYTLLCTGIWCTVLTLIGYSIGENQAMIVKYSHHAVIGFIIFSVVLIALYVRRQRKKRMKIKTIATNQFPEKIGLNIRG